MNTRLCRVLHVRIKSFIFVLNTVKAYWKALSRDMEAIGEGQARPWGERRRGQRGGVTPVRRLFQLDSFSVTLRTCQKLSIKIQVPDIPKRMPRFYFTDPFAIRCDHMIKFQPVKCEQKWNVLLGGCCSRLYSTSFTPSLLPLWGLDSSGESGNLRVAEQLSALVPVPPRVRRRLPTCMTLPDCLMRGKYASISWGDFILGSICYRSLACPN